MNIPPGKTEAEVLASVEKCVNMLASSFVFGHFDEEDIKQEGRKAALELLAKEKYDPSLPLDNYLFQGIRNALINLKRNKCRRTDYPCVQCHEGKECRDAPLGGQCSKYMSWYKRNQTKANIANPLAIEHISDEKEKRTRVDSSVESDVEIADLLQRIDAKLPIELRQTYLQMRAGVSVNKGKRLQVERAILEICGGAIEGCPSEED